MWFQELFGFEEETPEQVRENLVLRGEVLHSNVNGRSFQCAPHSDTTGPARAFPHEQCFYFRIQWRPGVGVKPPEG